MIGVYMASRAKSWKEFMFYYAGIYPLGIGVTYFPPILCGWEHFPNRKGFVTGLTVGGFGFGAFIFGFFSTSLVKTGDMEQIKVENG